MDEEEIVSQMRTVMSAGYETVSAVVAVGFNALPFARVAYDMF